MGSKIFSDLCYVNLVYGFMFEYMDRFNVCIECVGCDKWSISGDGL